MKIFNCDSCGGLVFFENVTCLKCGHSLGFLPSVSDLCAIEKTGDGIRRALRLGMENEQFRLCENSQNYEVCNWLIPIKDPNPLCVACRVNEVIPDLSVRGNVERWHKFENAKRLVFYTILKLGLPIDAVPLENRPALKFQFVADIPGEQPILTGHLDGIITLNISEADDPERERRRVNFSEPYRTLLGHLRHETAHYFWDRLIANSNWLPRFRELFGDENRDYANALQKYYAQGAAADWQSRYVSAYCSAHPWEDWAETWAHYFHIIDMMETAASFGLTLKPHHPAADTMTANPVQANDDDFDELLSNWFPLTHALNSLNRGMGLLDIYPFVVSAPAMEKLRFIHQVARSFTH